MDWKCRAMAKRSPILRSNIGPYGKCGKEYTTYLWVGLYVMVARLKLRSR